MANKAAGAAGGPPARPLRPPGVKLLTARYTAAGGPRRPPSPPAPAPAARRAAGAAVLL